MRLLQVKICTDVVINHTCVCWGGGERKHSTCGSYFNATREEFPSVIYSATDFNDDKCSSRRGILRIAKTFIRYHFKSDKRGLVGNAIGHRWKLEYFYPLGKAIKSIWISDGLRMTHHNILHTTGQKISSCYWKTLWLPRLHLIIKILWK